ncbi:MAG: hypothetical protein RJQ00_06415 [Vicingaceae bacterium]
MGAFADPIEFETTEDGTVPAGAIKISFYNEGTSVAIVNGIRLKVGKATNFGFMGKPYRAIEYQTNGSTLFIRYTL